MRGLYVQIYPSTLEQASRMVKIGLSVHAGVGFEATELVGVHRPGLPARASLAEGVDLIRVPGSARSGNLGRVLRAALWQPRVFVRYRRRAVAVVACHNVWILPMCFLLARVTGAALVYNPHELETETYTMRGVKKVVAKLIETALVRRCSLVSAVNEPIAQWYAEHYRIARPVVVGNVPVVQDAEVGLRQRLDIGAEEMLYVHTGHLAGGRNIPRILEAFSRSPHHVLFLGDGPLRPDVVAAGAAFANIHWMPPVEADLIVAHMREADVGLCLIEADLDLSKQLSSPNKLTEALAAGTPALCTDLIEARRVLGALSETWVLRDIDELEDALQRISHQEVADFRASWSGVPAWSDEVRPLVEAYRGIVGSAPDPGDTLNLPSG
jgi:glycosyltransferase involved in cell wall biosynthesis